MQPKASFHQNGSYNVKWALAHITDDRLTFVHRLNDAQPQNRRMKQVLGHSIGALQNGKK